MWDFTGVIAINLCTQELSTRDSVCEFDTKLDIRVRFTYENAHLRLICMLNFILDWISRCIYHMNQRVLLISAHESDEICVMWVKMRVKLLF